MTLKYAPTFHVVTRQQPRQLSQQTECLLGELRDLLRNTTRADKDVGFEVGSHDAIQTKHGLSVGAKGYRTL